MLWKRNWNFICVLLCSFITSGSFCANNGDVQLKNPHYIKFENGFFYLHGLTNGASLLLYKTPSEDNVIGQYAFLNSDCIYVVNKFLIIDDINTQEDPVLISQNEFNIYDKIVFNVAGAENIITYRISYQGLSVESNLKNEDILVKPIQIKGQHNFTTAEIPKKIRDYDIIEKEKIKYAFMDNGEFLFQKIYFNSLAAGTYAFKTADRKYHTLSYVILDKNYIRIEAYIISDEESYYDPGRIDIKGANGVQWLNFFIDAKGFHIKDIMNPGEYVSDVLDLDFEFIP
ncbi:unnamed protein product [Diamesa tonsa]